MQAIPLQSKLCTDSEDITYAVSDEAKFAEKSQLFWNGTLRNTRVKQDVGFPSTSGKTINYEATDGGVNLLFDNKSIEMPFTSVLKDYYKVTNKAAGKQIAKALWKDYIYTLYKDDQQNYIVVKTDLKDNEIGHKALEKDTSAMITSVYNIDEEPLIFINKKTKFSITNFINNVSVYKLTDWFDFKDNQPEYDYKLDGEKAVNVQILKAKYEDQTTATAEALREYTLALNTYYYTQKATDKVKAEEKYAAYLAKYNELQSIEKEYLKALWDYNPQEEIDYCNEQIDKETNEKSVTEKALKAIEEQNASQLEEKTTLETNIANLDSRIASLREEIYSAKAPELSEEAKAIKKEADAKLEKVQEEYTIANQDYLNSVKDYLANLDKFTFSFSWSWSISSTQSRSASYAFSGKKLHDALPPYLPTVGRYIATGATIEVNSNAVGTLSGSGSIDGNKVRLSTNSGNGFTYVTAGSVAYLSSLNGVFYGFNYNAIEGYHDVVNKYQIKQEASGQVAASKVEWTQTMNSNVELSNYLAFINNYESMKEELEQYVINVSLLRSTYGALLNEIDEVLRQINNKTIELEHITKTLEDLRKQLAKATLDLEALPKSEKIDDHGNVVYKTLASIFDWESTDGVPLGDANSGTTFRDYNSSKWIVVGFDDDDKNRSIVLYWNEDEKKVRQIKWYGVVDVKGLITGEPIPDPDTFTERTRQSNGTYRWDMQNGGNSRIAGSLIGGYFFNTTTNAYEKIVIDKWKAGESVRVNISANDTLTEQEQKDGKPDPIRFFVTNFADSRGIYYDYGQGWLKTYVRKTNPSARQIFDCYIYTYGMVSENNLPWQKESVMAKGKTSVWTYNQDKLNKRVYTVGGTNKADDSLLTLLPFSVNVLPEETNSKTGQALPTLRAQIYGLTLLSFSYNKSLVSNGEEHGEFQVQTFEDTIILSVNSMIYVIKKTSSVEDFKVWKVADYYFQTNILSDDNVIVEDRDGNINVVRGNIPYCEECKLDIEDLNLTIPPAEQLVTNDTWYWAAAYNPFFLQGVNSSYILPAIAIPLFIDSTQLEAFQTEALEQRGSILKPMLKGLFDEYEAVDIFYTVATVTSTLYYKTSNIVKVSDIDEDKYDIFGKETFNVDLNGTTYAVSTTTQFFPLGVGSVLTGVNYITPTVGLEDEYAVRLYTNNNRVYGGYQYAARIFNGTNVFTIYGRNYYYDRQGIYFIGTSSTYTANQFVCYALGMKYLANSGSEAYFYSPFDKSIYIFTGSNTLQKMLDLSNQAEIKDSIFSSQEQILYLLTEDDSLLMMKEGDVAKLDDVPVDSFLQGTELGCALINDNSYEIISPYRKDWQYLPLKLSTVFMGSDASLTKLAHFDFLAYKVSEKPVDFTIKVTTLNGIERQTETMKITIKPNMWKGRTYRIRYSPRNNVGNSFQVGIYSDDDVAISFHGWEASSYGNGQGAPR